MNEIKGCRVIIVGDDVPAKTLVDICEKHGKDVVVINPQEASKLGIHEIKPKQIFIEPIPIFEPNIEVVCAKKNETPWYYRFDNKRGRKR